MATSSIVQEKAASITQEKAAALVENISEEIAVDISKPFSSVFDFFEPLFSLSLGSYIVIALCIFLWMITPKLMQRFYPSTFDLQQLNRQRVARAVILYTLYFYIRALFPQYLEHWLTTMINVLATVYLAYTSFKIIDYYILKRYGNLRENQGKTKVSETYSSRMLSLLARMLVFVIGLIFVIRMLGYESLLETGGAIGIIGVFLALTQSVWAPDIFNGLILLNSEMLDEDDVIEICHENIVGVVFKIKMFHTEILNLKNNHRLMIRNAKLRDYVIHNFSAFSSAKGLREQLLFNIGYDNTEDAVREMFNEAFASAANTATLPIEFQHALEITVEDCGDNAVLWGVHYYIKDVKQVLFVRKQFREVILKHARTRRIALATPTLFQRTSNLGDEAHFPISAQERRLAEKINAKTQVAKEECPQKQSLQQNLEEFNKESKT